MADDNIGPDGDRARKRGLSARVLRGLCLPLLLAPGAALADSVSVVAEQDLRFGALVVPASGTRTIGADGGISDSGVLAIGGAPAGPARFTVTYDRESGSSKPINILLQVYLTGPQTDSQGGVTGRLSRFETDLPGSASLHSGSVATFTIAGCRARRCSQTFRVGARLQVDRSQGGAELVFALPVTASIMAVY